MCHETYATCDLLYQWSKQIYTRAKRTNWNLALNEKAFQKVHKFKFKSHSWKHWSRWPDSLFNKEVTVRFAIAELHDAAKLTPCNKIQYWCQYTLSTVYPIRLTINNMLQKHNTVTLQSILFVFFICLFLITFVPAVSSFWMGIGM